MKLHTVRVGVKLVPLGKVGIAISQVLASLEPCFYARSIVRMALRRLTEKDPFMMNLSEKKLYSFYPRGTHFTSTDPG